jgi:hypothetical protein
VSTTAKSETFQLRITLAGPALALLGLASVAGEVGTLSEFARVALSAHYLLDSERHRCGMLGGGGYTRNRNSVSR